MSDKTVNEDEVYFELDKLLNSVNEEEEMMKNMEKNKPNGIETSGQESNGLADIKRSEDKKDDGKIDAETTINNSKDKNEKDDPKVKKGTKEKETKEKETNKKKYDKKSDSKAKEHSRKEDPKRIDKKRSRTPSKDRSSKDSSLKKRSKAIDKEKESKKLRELDKFWQTVRDDPSDFIGWTYLLQYVDGAKNIEAAREAYDAFLELYPYCYGYWRKYADYERKNGTKENCEKIFFIRLLLD